MPHPSDQRQALRQARALWVLTLVLGGVALLFGLALALTGGEAVQTVVNLAGAVFAASLLAQQHLGVSHRVCVVQLLLVIAIAASGSAIISGGILSPTMTWMVTIPVVGLALDRSHTAAIGSAIVVVATVVVGILSLTGWTQPMPTPSPIKEVMTGTLLIIMTGTVFGVAALSDRMRRAVRTDLQSTNRNLQAEVQRHDATRQRLNKTHRELVDAAREAGAAEVATGVLHNLGNALTAVNVSASLTEAKVVSLRLDRVQRLTQVLPGPEHETLRRYIEGVQADLERSRTEIRAELESLRTGVNHAIATVIAQQQQAGNLGVTEAIALQELLNDALLLSTHRHDVTTQVRIDCRRVPRLILDRHRLVQIVTNLVGNAHDAIRPVSHPGRIQVVGRLGDDMLELTVQDNGVGIAPEDMDRVFAHGFTTKSDGHGFGLHACALSAEEVGGSLQVDSDGPGKGATFILRLPVETVRPSLLCGPPQPRVSPA